MSPVRPLTPAEAAAYTVIRREMLLDSPWSFSRTPEDDPGCDAAGMAKSLAAASGYAVVGAFDEGRLVAVAGIHRPPQRKLAHRAHIWGVYVTSSHRQRGLAPGVVMGAVEAARRWDGEPRVTSVGLSVSERAPGARALYLKLGFVPWGFEPGSVQIEGESAGETHMLLTL